MLYRMPAEWEAHAACWMAWPCRQSLWENMAMAKNAFAQVAQAISQFELVNMVCTPADHQECLAKVGHFAEVIVWPLNDSWSRDFGPTFVKDSHGKTAVVNWQFNGWGNRFKPYHDDAQFAERVAAHCQLPLVDSRLVTEGGAIHVDGEGTLLTTRECLLNPNRNPDWSCQDIEQEFARTLGINKTIWLDRGLIDDHTDGHIDELACFVAPGQVVALVTDDKSDDNFLTLQSNVQCLSNEKDAVGRQLKVSSLHQPEPRFLPSGERMSLSYINFYLANEGIVMAEFNQPDYDRAAKNVLQTIFPNRQVVQIPAIEIFNGGGGIHCITQQQPR